MNAHISAKERRFLPQDFVLNAWPDLEPFLEDLKKRELASPEALQKWLHDLSELEAVVGEDACWRQIKMTCDTTNEAYEQAFAFFVSEIEPKLKPYTFEFNKKLIESPFINSLDPAQYFPYLRSVKNQIALFRPENITLQSEISLLAQKYGSIAGAMTIEHEGKQLTLQQAAKLLQEPDRVLRETIFRKIAARRLQDKEALDELFDTLLQKRHQVALNAGFENYRDYKFRELGRFDYTPEDCFRFHEAVKKHILPIQHKLELYRKQRLGVSTMYPWDTMAEPEGTQPLHPFKNGDELLQKSIAVFDKLGTFFGDCLREMKTRGRLDLDSRNGKAPGGYNCPLPETGVPFIFMNAAGTVSDVITMMHEGGHAVHSFLSHNLELSAFKEYPMEIAELASMSMELFTMEHWNEFFDAKDHKRAQLEELERVLDVLPWIATIDKFQHWLYTHPSHSRGERSAAWLQIVQEFSTGEIDWSVAGDYQAYLWQKQLHLYEVPFYYIEYGIAQLGAIAMWQQYQQNKEQALANYNAALSQGYTKTLKELYMIAGISFDFGESNIEKLGKFVNDKLLELM